MVAKYPPPQYLLLHDISWHGYETLLDELEGRRLRVTYDCGRLEIMTKSYEHENFGELLSHFLRILTVELAISMCSGGSTTFKKKSLEKGLEPDKCWWIQNEPEMRHKRTFDIDRDPPPDLAIEIEITCSALERMGIYAALKVPEVWCFDGETLSVFHLAANGKYRARQTSRAFPFLPLRTIQHFLNQVEAVDETNLLRAFTQWVREDLAPSLRENGGKTKAAKNGKRSGK